MINKETILKLYNGELCPIEITPYKNMEYKENLNKITYLEKQISYLLSDDKKHLLEDYYEVMNKNSSSLSEQAFIDGFSLGLKLSAEAFIEEK